VTSFQLNTYSENDVYTKRAQKENTFLALSAMVQNKKDEAFALLFSMLQ